MRHETICAVVYFPPIACSRSENVLQPLLALDVNAEIDIDLDGTALSVMR
jgi:hypothetical protein